MCDEGQHKVCPPKLLTITLKSSVTPIPVLLSMLLLLKYQLMREQGFHRKRRQASQCAPQKAIV
jgi:hypothetical protein